MDRIWEEMGEAAIHCHGILDPVKGIDDKESGYDDSQERRELEKAADMLFG